MRKISVSIWLVCLSLIAIGQDTLTVKDLSNEWSFYNSSYGGYVPLVKKSAFEGETIHFIVDAEKYPGTELQIGSSQPISIVVNNQLIAVVNGSELWSLDSIAATHKKKQLPITIYAPSIKIGGLSTKLIAISSQSVKPLEGGLNISTRDPSHFINFLLTAFFVLIIFLTTIQFFYPKMFSDYFRAGRALALRETEENLLKSRPLATVNISMTSFLSLSASLLIVGVLYMADVKDAEWLSFGSFGEGVWAWLKLAIFILLWFFLKLLLVNYSTQLFRLNNFFASHHFNYVRLNLLFISLGLVVLIIFRFAFEIVDEAFYYKMFFSILIALSFTILVIALKLMNGGGYKIVYLFSYLCATEIVPYGLFLSIGINQSF